MSYRGIELPNQLAQYGQVQQIQAAQNQNRMADLQMAEYARKQNDFNRLRGLDPSSPGFINEVMQIDPQLGSELSLRKQQQTTAERQANSAESEIRGRNLSYWQSLARDGARTPSDDVLKMLRNQSVALGITDEATADARLQQILAMPVEQRTQILSQFGAPATVTKETQPPNLANRYKPVGRLVFDTETGQYITPPATTGAGPAAAAPAAPAAKPPTAAQTAKTETRDQAKQALSSDLQTVLGYYNQLDKIGAMGSPNKNIVENVLASARSTGLGQEIERTAATEAQTLRDNISNSRQRLLVHIKNATGASAQQMNSNVELQTWLNALTNPRQSIETVRETLGQLDSVIASVQSQIGKEAPSKTATPSPANMDIANERANAKEAIAAGAPEAAVRKRFKENTGQEL
jgi:hypothetical protein